MRSWPARRWLVVTVASLVTALFIGVPTGIIGTPLYHRMTPVLWWNYPVWALTALLSGLLWATYVRSADDSTRPSQIGVGSGVLSLLAVGCPICNKIVVLAIGVSGALTVWAPLQPALAVVSLSLLGWALRQRLRGERRCTVASRLDVVVAERGP